MNTTNMDCKTRRIRYAVITSPTKTQGIFIYFGVGMETCLPQSNLFTSNYKLADEQLDVNVFPCTAGFDEGLDLAFSFSRFQGLIETSEGLGSQNVNFTAEEQAFGAFSSNDLDHEVRRDRSAADPIFIGSEDQLLALDPFNQLVRIISKRCLSNTGIGHPILGGKITQLMCRI